MQRQTFDLCILTSKVGEIGKGKAGKGGERERGRGSLGY